ncbi:MAG: beta-glucosidase BglX [Bacteroidales bacterium]|nr:beta-glucosidase BglX [Bacteroidales bacterium]
MKKQWIGMALTIMITMTAGAQVGDTEREEFVDSLIQRMTLEEKIGQLTLFTSDWASTGPTLREGYKQDIQSGKCGNIFNAHTAAYNRKLQQMAVEETRLGIPLLFGYDIIHGYKTIFPIPLAEACSWDLGLIEKSARLSAREAAAGGLNWTFNPMVDITYDPRWGRIAEGSGEDPYYSSKVAAAKVKGYQGKKLEDPLTLAACMKHFAAYGAAEAGRDYNTVDMSERRLREIYLPPFKASIDAGVATVMTAFNELNGIPATGNKFLFREILREEWNFKGMVVTDYTSIEEMVNHGYAQDEKHAGELALNAGIDMDMQSAAFYNYLAKSLEEGKVTMSDINSSVKNVLMLKYDLGLFDDPYKYIDETREENIILSQEMKDHALESAMQSIVLLKNEKFNGSELLPINTNTGKTIAVIGPLADNQTDMLGTWHAAGVDSEVVTLMKGLRKKFPNAQFNYAFGGGFEGNDQSGFMEAIEVAKQSDLVIMALGENYRQNGEAASRSNIDLPGPQKELIKEIYQTGKPVISLVMAGRPLTIGWMDENIPAIVYAWHLGTRAGDAIAEVLSGDYNPSGKLVCTFPRNTGQIPIYYNHKNTGRPFDADNKYTTRYLDIPNEPLYPFGYGLSYTSFEYDDLELDKEEITFGEKLQVSVKVTNTGNRRGEEVVQLYVRDLVGSVTRPVKELKGFKKISLDPSETKHVMFSLTPDDLRFYAKDMNYVAEPGDFKVFAGGNAIEVLEADFKLVE